MKIDSSTREESMSKRSDSNPRSAQASFEGNDLVEEVSKASSGAKRAVQMSEVVDLNSISNETELDIKKTDKKGGNVKSRRASTRRRSGRLQVRSAFHEEIELLVAGKSSASELSLSEIDHRGASNASGVSSIDKVRLAKISQLEELLLEPFEQQSHWPMAGRKLFEPEGILHPRAMKWLGRKGGTKHAPSITYTEVYEVGLSCVSQNWRKKTLSCKSFESLLLQIRVLDSYLNKPVSRLFILSPFVCIFSCHLRDSS
jgi:hypothetical protein